MSSAGYITPGQLRCRAALQARVRTPDGMGGNTTSWATERYVWVAIRNRGSGEQIQGMREQSWISHEIWSRYADDITADKRLEHNGKTYNIRAVLNPKARNEFLRILAESGVAT